MSLAFGYWEEGGVALGLGMREGYGLVCELGFCLGQLTKQSMGVVLVE